MTVESGAGNAAAYAHRPLSPGEIWIFGKIVESTWLLNVRSMREEFGIPMAPFAGLTVTTRNAGSGLNLIVKRGFSFFPFTSVAVVSIVNVYNSCNLHWNLPVMPSGKNAGF